MFLKFSEITIFDDSFVIFHGELQDQPTYPFAHAALITVAFVSGLIRLWLVDRTAFSMIEMAPILVEYFLSGLKH